MLPNWLPISMIPALLAWWTGASLATIKNGRDSK